MKILKRFFTVLLVIIVLLIIVSLFLPSTVHVERTITVGASPEVVFEQINNFKNWGKWSPWHKRDPNMTITYTGPESGKGAGYTWDSKHDKVGSGSMEVIESKPFDEIVEKMSFGGMGISYATFKLEKKGDSTKITWMLDSKGEGVPLLWKVPSKFFNLTMDNMIGPDFESGLKDLKTLTENMPKPEPRKMYEVKEVSVEKRNVLSMRSAVDYKDMMPFFASTFTELTNYAEKSKLKGGMMGAVYHHWDTIRPDIEVFMEVDKPGKDYSKNGVDIKAAEWPAAKALMADYYGAYTNEMGLAHGDIQNFAKEKRKKIKGAPWEEYPRGPFNDRDTAKWHTKIYYPIE